MKAIQGTHDYFKSIRLWGTPVYVTGGYYIKYRCKIELASEVVKMFNKQYPNLNILFLKNKAQTHVVFGGHYLTSSGVLEFLKQSLSSKKG